MAPSTDGSLGWDTSMVDDEAGDPMIAYEWFSPGGSIDATSFDAGEHQIVVVT